MRVVSPVSSMLAARGLGLAVVCWAVWVEAGSASGSVSGSRSRLMWSPPSSDWAPVPAPLSHHPHQPAPSPVTALDLPRAARQSSEEDDFEEDYSEEAEDYESTNYSEDIQEDTKKTDKKRKGGHVKLKLKGIKKLKKYMLPILIAYKLKFLLMIPILLGGMFLLMGTTAFAGFFFALFAVGLSLKKDH